MATRRIFWAVAPALMLGFLYWGRNRLHRMSVLDPLFVAVCFACTGCITVTSALKWQVSLGRASYSVYPDRTVDGVIAGLACFRYFGRETARLLSLIFHFRFKPVSRIPWLGRGVEFETERKLLEGGDFRPTAPALYALSGVKFLLTALRFIVIAAAMGVGINGRGILLCLR